MIIKFNQQSPTLDKNNHSSCQFKGTTRTFNWLKSESSLKIKTTFHSRALEMN